MKKNYEKDQLLLTMCFLFIIVEIITIMMCLKLKYQNFSLISVTMITKNYVSSYVDDKDLKVLNNNKKLYINNKKYNYEITSITRKVVKKGKWYHEIIMRINLPKKYNDKDIITIGIFEKKKNIIDIFRNCLEG